MLITDSWYDKKYNKTAVYCDNIGGIDLSKITKVQIDHEEYNVIDFDMLISISGRKNTMLLLDTSKQISFPQEAIVS